MVKSELIVAIASKNDQLSKTDIDLAVKLIIDTMSNTLSNGRRIEIRGFGSFSIHIRAPRIARNPKTSESIPLPSKRAPHFKPGKELKEAVIAGKENKLSKES